MPRLIYSYLSAILASVFLKERLGPIGIIGCALSLIGAVIIVLHAPEDPEVQSVEELVQYMLQPGEMIDIDASTCMKCSS